MKNKNIIVGCMGTIYFVAILLTAVYAETTSDNRSFSEPAWTPESATQQLEQRYNTAKALL